AADRIDNVRENDGDGARLRQERRGRERAARKNEIGGKPDEFLREPSCRLGVEPHPAGVELNIATLRPSELLESLAECGEECLIFGVVLGRRHQHADSPHPAALLRTRRERPEQRKRRRRAADERDELAARHSITSSARPSSVSGTVSPSALAVLRLRISSTLVNCCTGRSAGFSPLRIRPT